jgi:hypothetical protein
MRPALFALLSMLAASLVPVTLAAQAEGEGGARDPLVFVTVAGAPGDGEQVLAAALTKELAARGLTPATAFQANVYEVQGTVKLAPAGKGKQSVTIIWVVLGPDGTQLGITRQTKTIRKGSLDKRWGAAAQAAAQAAAADIVKLIPH